MPSPETGNITLNTIHFPTELPTCVVNVLEHIVCQLGHGLRAWELEVSDAGPELVVVTREVAAELAELGLHQGLDLGQGLVNVRLYVVKPFFTNRNALLESVFNEICYVGQCLGNTGKPEMCVLKC